MLRCHVAHLRAHSSGAAARGRQLQALGKHCMQAVGCPGGLALHDLCKRCQLLPSSNGSPPHMHKCAAPPQ